VSSRVELVLPTGTASFLSARVRAGNEPSDRKTVDPSGLRAVLSALAVRHGGVLLGGPNTSGGPAVAFAAASDAVACALALERELADRPGRPQVGVHTGDVDKGAEAGYAGAVLSRCLCLRDSASAGQLVLSQATADLIAGGLPAGATLIDLGWHRLPDLGPPAHLWQLGHADTEAEFPPLRTLDAGRHNLPVLLTSFVGRDGELAELGRLLRETRLVTLTGSGGCGKTRLALQAAAERVAYRPDGVWLAELAALRDPEQVPTALAAAMTVHEPEAVSVLDALGGAIGEQAPLVVLDNCEHLVRRCAEVVEHLLLVCPQIQFLATSREPLGVPGEMTWRVPSLSFPTEVSTARLEDLRRFEAVQLFVERARRARPRFALTEENTASVAEICTRLDGIPLALELAAARTRVLPPNQIAAGLHDRLQLLTGGSRTAVPRQQTLEASVAWSYDLLEEPEQALLRRLSVFAGGFTIPAAEAVGPDDEIAPNQVLGLVSQLADKSLVVAGDDADGRFRMLETIRRYAARCLDEAGEEDDTRRRHFEHFFAAADRRPTEGEDHYRQRLRADYDNLRKALEWAADQDDPGLLLVLATRLATFWSLSIHLAEARHWLRIAIDRGGSADPVHRARALGSLSQVASLAADMSTAMSAGTEGLDLLRQLGDTQGMIVTLTSLGSSATIMAEPDAGRGYLEEAAALAEATGDRRSVAYALALTGRTAVNSATNRDAGRTALRHSIEIAEECGAKDVECIALCLLGVLDALDCKPSAAAAQLTEALPELREAGDGFFLSFCLVALVHSQTLLGDFDGAEAACRELDAIGKAMGAARLYFAARARGWLAFCQGHWAESVSFFREQLSYYASVALRGRFAGDLAWAELLAGHGDAARQRLDDFVRSADPDRTCLALPLAVRALIARTDGDHDSAEELAVRAVAVSPTDAFGRLTVWSCLTVLAAIKADGSFEVATRLAGASAAFARDVSLTPQPALKSLIEPALHRCREALGDARFAETWAEGERLALEEAAAYATRGRGRRRRHPHGWSSLTPTELKVATAVADGLSNPEIANRMFISRRTVATHLTAIFRKLAISSRSELAAQAVRHEVPPTRST
jgi:predicted ATPase/DNA-binding CsgD family transcriptional regulator